MKPFRVEDLTDLQTKDMGILIGGLSILIGYLGSQQWLVFTGLAVLLIAIVFFRVFRWPAIYWFRLAAFLARYVSIVVFGLMFFLVVTPVAAVLRLGGYDPLLRKGWRRDGSSMLQKREKAILEKDDLVHPY